MLDSNALGDLIAELLGDHVERAMAPLIAENAALKEANGALSGHIAALEAREMPRPLDMDEVRALVADAVAAIPPPQDGKSVDMDEVRALVADVVAAIPVPQDGKSVDMDEVRALVADAVAAIPVPEDGAPGIGVAGALKNAQGHLILTLSNGSLVDIGRVDGQDGKNGETFTLDDFDIEPVDERTIKLGFERGHERHTFELEFPVPIYRGVWREGETYQRGDMVTWAGSTWHCDASTAAKPGDAGGNWTLAVKAGRPGRDKS